jgi:hypothetical protein
MFECDHILLDPTLGPFFFVAYFQISLEPERKREKKRIQVYLMSYESHLTIIIVPLLLAHGLGLSKSFPSL